MWNIRSSVERQCILVVAALGLALLLEGSPLRAETTNALTLTDCLRESLSANHTLLARSASAAQQVRAARSGYWPTVEGAATYGPRADFHSGEEYEMGFASVALTWNIWDFGPTKSRVSEAPANQRVREEAVAETALQRRLELANAEAGVRAAAARIEASRPSVEQAQESLRIEQRKYELGQGTITDVLDTQSAAVESESLRARAALAQAEQTADDYSFRGPWAGVVSRVRVADGNYVAPRTPLVDLYDPASLVLRFAVPEDHAFALSVGGRVQVTFDALPGRAFTLEIIRAYPELDRRLRTRSFEAALPKDATFPPGMFARIRAVLEEQPSALTVPAEAVLGDGVKPFAFVLTDDKAARRPVETGFEQDGRVWIRTGLTVGDHVIVGGIERVKDGAPVRLEGSKPAAKAEGEKPSAKAAKP